MKKISWTVLIAPIVVAILGAVGEPASAAIAAWVVAHPWAIPIVTALAAILPSVSTKVNAAHSGPVS